VGGGDGAGKIWWWREEERGAERNAAAGASEERNETERQIGHGKETARKGKELRFRFGWICRQNEVISGSALRSLFSGRPVPLYFNFYIFKINKDIRMRMLLGYEYKSNVYNLRASLAVIINRRELKNSGGFTVSVLGLRATGAHKWPSPKTIFSGPRTLAHPAPTYIARRREFGSEPVLLRRENPSRRRRHREHTSTPASN
jgi:hypothetical protein